VIQLKSPREIDSMAAGGRILAGALHAMANAVRPGVSTTELDDVAAEYMKAFPGAEAAFKGLYGFPKHACISVNEEIVHGIPSGKRVLQEGDIVSLDFGVKYLGFFTDAAITVGVGEIDEPAQRLIDVTRRALEAGVAAAQPGKHVGDIGAQPFTRWFRTQASRPRTTSWGITSVMPRTGSRRSPTWGSRTAAPSSIPA
jgi:methionyl aminopeptidase